MAFDLNKNKEELREIEVNDRLERHKEYNRKQKNLAKVIGENFATWAVLMIFALMITFIWTDIGLFTSLISFISDAIVTIVLYILMDIICASYIGGKGGKLDDDYIVNHNEYLDVRKTVQITGMTLMDVFCDWQIDLEYEFYLRKRCKDLKIDYNEYMEKYHGKTLEELQEMFPIEKGADKNPKLKFWKKIKNKVFGGIQNAKTSSKAAKVFSLNQIKHIELSPDILMTDGKVRNQRGDVGVSGEEYIERHTVGFKHILATVIFGIVAVIPTFSLISNISVGMIIYTVFKIALMLFRMYRGYSRGAKAFNTVEPKHLQAKTKYLYKYLEFLKNKTYLDLGDKYEIVGVPKEAETEAEIENKPS